MGENHFTYANNSLRVQPRTQIYLVALIAQPVDRTLSLLQTGSLGSKVGPSAAHNQLKSLKRMCLHRIRKFSKLLHGDCEASGGRSWFRIGQCYLNVIFVRETGDEASDASPASAV